MLLQVPKGLGGTKIHAAAVTAAITGTTILVENKPGKPFKLIVLEGSVHLSSSQALHHAVDVHAGEMSVVTGNGKSIAAPVSVDLKTILNTSALLKSGSYRNSKTAALPSLPLIEKEVRRQKRELTGQTLAVSDRQPNGLAHSLTPQLNTRISAAQSTLAAQQAAVISSNTKSSAVVASTSTSGNSSAANDSVNVLGTGDANNQAAQSAGTSQQNSNDTAKSDSAGSKGGSSNKGTSGSSNNSNSSGNSGGSGNSGKSGKNSLNLLNPGNIVQKVLHSL